MLWQTKWLRIGSAWLIAALLATAGVSIPTPVLAQDEGLAAEEEHIVGKGEEGEAIKLELNLAVFTAVVFGIMLLILWRFAWTPILKSLDQREARMRAMYDEAEGARAEARRVEAEYQARLQQAADEVRGLIEEARRDAQTTKADILAAANQEAAEIRQRMERSVQLAKDEALKDLWNKAAELAAALAARVVPRTLTDEDHRKLVEVSLSELNALPAVGSAAEARV